MGITKRTSAEAVKDARGHEAKAAELEVKATDSATTIERMEAESVDAIVADPRQAEKIDAEITAQWRMARAFTAKADQHRSKATEFYREALDLEATELHREADKLDKQAEQHTARVDDLLTKLRELDGLEYGPRDRVKTDGGDWVAQNLGASVATKLRNDAETIRIKADNNRFFLATGKRAFGKQDLNAELGSKYSVTVMPMHLQAHHVSELLGRVTAGTTPRFDDTGGVSAWDGEMEGTTPDPEPESSTHGRL
ncbi:hypothetical protein [Citricoccus sp. GCM10030269]|uniref:hypothetical protein n=1 Tax=Citricoccus sp. GCM10030269 TaxID=3273388 RepID=UPI0036216530